MDSSQIVDIWMVFKDSIDKKHIEIVAEKFVDVLADYGVSDHTFQQCLDVDDNLDQAIEYYLDSDVDDEDDYDEWDD
jgi:hypothetical protein